MPDVMAGEAEVAPDRVDDLLTAGMYQPVTDIAAAQPGSRQQPADDELGVGPYDIGDVRVQEEAELTGGTVPVVAHGLGRIGDDVAGERQNPRPPADGRQRIVGLPAAGQRDG